MTGVTAPLDLQSIGAALTLSYANFGPSKSDGSTLNVKYVATNSSYVKSVNTVSPN